MFSDPDWVSCSPLARILYIGLWTDADDQGIFEWKPLQIRMRLFPGDDADVPTLLGELSAVDLVSAFEVNGKKFGAIKNFRKFQRPKKPNSIHPCPAEWRTYVALDAAGSELGDDEADEVPNSPASKVELGPQMEDGGDSKNPPNPPSGAIEHADAYAELCRAYPSDGLGSPAKRDAAWPVALATGADPWFIVRAAHRFAGSQAAKPSSGRVLALHRWLTDRRWVNHPDPPNAVFAKPNVMAWNGPASLRDLIEAETDPGWTRAWIDGETLFRHVPPSAVVANSRLAHRRIEERIGKFLRAQGVELILAEAAA